MAVKVGSKRSFDFIQYPSPVSCSPHKISSLDGSDSQLNKKRRLDANTPAFSGFNSPVRAIGQQEREKEDARALTDSNAMLTSSQTFLAPEASFIDNNAIYEWLPKNKRAKFPTADNEKFFTLAEVKYIVAKALAHNTKNLREDFQKEMAEKLQEQFAMFTKFNQDNIERQLQTSTYDYMS